jgi:hypothetical protein
VSGTSLFAGNYVYREPLWGWTGSVRPTAFLYQARASGLVPGTDQVSGEAVARPASSQSATGVWLYSEPAGGWTGTRSAVPAVGFVHGWGNHSVAFSSPDVFTAGPASVVVYEISGSFGRRARTPVLRHASLTGAGSRRPRVSFDLRAGVDAPPLRDFTLTLPRGLSFRSLRQVRAHLRILHSGRQIGLKLRSGRLLVRPLVPAVRISITLHPGALAERQALVGRLRAVRAFNRHHKQAETHSVRGTIRIDATTVGDATQHLVKTIEMR